MHARQCDVAAELRVSLYLKEIRNQKMHPKKTYPRYLLLQITPRVGLLATWINVAEKAKDDTLQVCLQGCNSSIGALDTLPSASTGVTARNPVL